MPFAPFGIRAKAKAQIIEARRNQCREMLRGPQMEIDSLFTSG